MATPMSTGTHSSFGRSPSPKLNSVQQKRLSERLHDESQARRERTLTALREKMLFNSSEHSKKKLNASQQEECVTNLYDQSRRKKETVMRQLEAKYLVNPQKNEMKLDKDSMEASVDKLYTQTLQRKQANMEKLERRYLPEQTSRTLDEEEMQESLTRLYRDHDTRRKDAVSKLREKYQFHHPSENKKISPETVKEMGKRLCTVAARQRDDPPWPLITSQETRDKLRDTYIKGTTPIFPKRSETDWQTTLSRLYVPK